MPINFSSYIFQETNYTDYNGASTQWNISGSALTPSASDVLLRFQAVYPQYDGNMFDAYDYAEGDGVVRYNNGYGYSYWRLVVGNVPITSANPLIFNGTELTKVTFGTTVVYAKITLYMYTYVSYSTKFVYFGETYGTLATPTRDGYTFEGWYTALTGGTRVYYTTIVTATATTYIYERWSLVYPPTALISFSNISATTMIVNVSSTGGFSEPVYIYIKKGSAPTTSNYDFRRALSGLPGGAAKSFVNLIANTTYVFYGMIKRQDGLGGETTVSDSETTASAGNEYIITAGNFIDPADVGVLSVNLEDLEIWVYVQGAWEMAWDGSNSQQELIPQFEYFLTLGDVLASNYFVFWDGEDWLENWKDLYVMEYDIKIIDNS